MKILFFFIALLFSFNSYSQDDGLIKYDPKKEYTQEYMDSLISKLRVAKKRMIKPYDFRRMLESDSTLLGWSYYYFGKTVVNERAEKNDSAIYYANKGLDHYYKAKIQREFNIHDVMLIYYYKGYIYNETKDYNKSVINYQKALDISKNYPHPYRVMFISGLGDGHYFIGNDSLARKYYSEALKDTIFSNLPQESVIANGRLGNLYRGYNGNDDKAIEHYNEALKISDSTDYKTNIALVNYYLGEMYFENNNIDSTLHYFKQAEKAEKNYGFKKSQSAKEQSLLYKSIIKIYENHSFEGVEDSLKLAINNLSSSEKLSKKSLELSLTMYKTLGILYQKHGNYEEYNNVINEVVDVMTSFQDNQLKEDIRNLETQYQTKEKDASIVQLEENEQQQNTIIKQQRTIAFGLGGLLLLLSGFGYLFLRQRKLKTQYEKENLEQRLLRSQMNPHFIGNAMNTVSALVNKQSKDAIPYINKLSSLFRLVLTNSREEFVSLDDELATLRSYLDLQSNFSKDFDFNFTIEDSIDQEDCIVPPMLMQPFVENAILHGLKLNDDRGKVDIRITKNDKGLLLCEIVDNGVGYSKDNEFKTRKSISGDIIRERLEIFKKKFKVNSRFTIKSKEQGTHVELYLPYLLDD